MSLRKAVECTHVTRASLLELPVIARTMEETLQPHILCKKGDVAKYVLMPGDPGRVLRIGKLLDDYKEIAFNREFRTITGTYKGIRVSATSSGIGGPSTAIAVEELANVGAKAIIRVGSCGALQPGMRIGDLVISQGVVREDGTSKQYVPIQYPAVPDPEVYVALVKAADSLKEDLGFKYWVGITRSEDALYSKEIRKLDHFWHEVGVVAAEMEASTLLTVGRLRGIKAGCIINVVDEFGEEPAEGIREYAVQAAKTKEGRAIEGERNMIRVALEAIVLLDRGSLIV